MRTLRWPGGAYSKLRRANEAKGPRSKTTHRAQSPLVQHANEADRSVARTNAASHKQYGASRHGGLIIRITIRKEEKEKKKRKEEKRNLSKKRKRHTKTTH